MTAERLNVALCWHMHQPWYREDASGYALPWVYLHAIKDYHDMAAHLEAVPAVRAVVNFTPTLLLQLEDYAQAIGRFLDEGTALPDPLLAALVAAQPPAGPEARAALLRAGLRANETRLIRRFPHYARLAELGRACLNEPGSLAWLDPQYFFDLLTWFHLAWLGETARRDSPTVRRLMEQGSGFRPGQRLELLRLVHGLLSGLTGRYRRLADAGQVELSFTPFGHPIAPLLLDLRSAREARPDLSLPGLASYPGGAERLRWHIARGLEVFERVFGRRPRGLWPAEGALSSATLQALAGWGLDWTASSVGVLRASEPGIAREALPHLAAWEAGPALPCCFFRDDELSDLIGFRYASWHADDAVGDLIHRLLALRARVAKPARQVVVLLLDGENAWEHYPDNGYHFLGGLYRALAEHPELEPVTLGEALAAGLERRALPRLRPGSWIHAELSTWVGAEAKNRAWEALAAARTALEAALAEGRLEGARLREAEDQLGVCEGSDWCWWLGSSNDRAEVETFDALYRRQLARLYALLGEPAPAALALPFDAQAAGAGGSGPMLASA